LGLTIAKRIAELHGGALRIDNREEGGVVVELIV
jgi:signal transduction histidine kinase